MAGFVNISKIAIRILAFKIPIYYYRMTAVYGRQNTAHDGYPLVVYRLRLTFHQAVTVRLRWPYYGHRIDGLYGYGGQP
jgi:hypothetical protein